MLCQIFAWLVATSTLIFGNDAITDFRYEEQPEMQMQISQDGKLIRYDLPVPDDNRSMQTTQSTQFYHPSTTTQPSQTPYYSQNESGFQTESHSFVQNNNQKPGVTDGRRPGMFQGATFGFSYLPDLGSHGFEMTQVRVGTTFGLPAPIKNSFFLLSPSFEPTFVKRCGPEPFPETLYSASLGCTLIRKINERWSAMAYVGPRWSSDGKETQSAVRCSLMGGMTWVKSPQLQFRFGVVYSNRHDSFNVLPFGGLVWTPNEDWKYELMAPMLRVARRCHSFPTVFSRDGESSHWGYFGIGFGGGTWAFQSVGNHPDVANYSEFSVVIGLESKRLERTPWKAELGYVFGRYMSFENHTMRDSPIGDTIVMRVTLAI